MLVRGQSKATGVYVRAHATATVRNIKSGTYTILIIFAVRGGNAPTTPISPKGFPAP